jgi:hypothetical protein
MPSLMRLVIVALLHFGLWILGATSLPDVALGILGAF